MNKGEYKGSGHGFKESVVDLPEHFPLAMFVSLRASTKTLVGFNLVSMKREGQEN